MSSTKLIVPGAVKVNTGLASMRAYFPDMKVESYSIGGTRAVGETLPETELGKDDVVVAEFENNIKWFYDKADFTEKLRQQQMDGRGSADGKLVVPLHWQDNSSTSRGIVTSAAKLLGINILKNVSGEKLALTIAHRIEQNNPNILYNCDPDFKLSSRFDPAIQKDPAASYLLLLHGTGSDTKGSFGGLNGKGSSVYRDLVKKYDGRIIAYEHKTFTQSPIQNVLELLNQLPDEVSLDLLSHSRGGLVGEILARIAALGDSGIFTSEEMKLLKQNEEADALVTEIETLQAALVKKKIKVNRFVRVACPAAGTTLVSDRMDTFLNVLLNVLSNVSSLGGEVLSTIVEVLEALVTAVVEEKNDVKVLPGIECMRPDSNFIKAINFSKTKINSDLVVIAGDAEGEGFINRIKMFLVDSFYKEDNDLVVNTSSMKKGTGRSTNFSIYDERRGNVNHFHYFINPSSQKIIYEALIGKVNETRGFYRNTDEEKDKVKPPVTEGAGSRGDKKTQPVLYVLPGIMGSYLEVESQRIWLNYFRIATGDLRLLEINAEGVKPIGIDGNAYKDLVDYFGNYYYVIPFAYDWRKSIFDAAKELNKNVEDSLATTEKTVSFIAHSMGGLVFRAFKINYPDTWRKLQQRPNFRVLLLGTPTLGSYEIPRLLMGIGRSINALSVLDLASSKKTLLQQFIQYPGLLQLLPTKAKDDFGDLGLWTQMQMIARSKYPIPAPADLAMHRELQKPAYANATWDSKIVKYIAGRDDLTPTRMEIDVENNKVNFYSTPRGDGSVTWDTIPTELLSASTFYVEAKHGKLADEASSFAGYKELLEKGETTLLKNQAPSTRSELRMELMPDIEPVTLPDEGALSKYIMGIEVAQPVTRLKQLKVSITHGDMGHALYPVIAGHFNGDGIVEAEKVLNRKLKNYLGIRHETKNYPGAIGTHEVLVSQSTRPPGAIVVGLGDFGSLTENQLTKTLKQGLLTYIVKANEQNAEANSDHGFGVSYLLIGSGFGGLSIFSSIKALLNAVNEANEFFESHSTYRYKIINDIEIIELYQHKAVQAGRIMGNLIKNSTMFSNIAFSPKILKRASGAKNEIPDEMQANWWHRLKVYVDDNQQRESGKTRIIKFSSVTDKARNEEEVLATNISIVDRLIIEAAAVTNNNKQLCQTLFEMLIPNEFKGYGSDLRNIVLMVDKETARYPWEMLQDPYGGNDEPLVARTGFLRQLSTSTYREKVELTTSNTVLVIGNPDLGDEFASLPAATEEAKKVARLLGQRGYDVLPFIEAQAREASMNLLINPYKIVHIAAHGVVNYKKTGQTGVVLGKDIIFTPSDFKQMRRVPELVFVNCCSLGTINKEQEEQFQRNYEVAAGVGTQLIEMGVKAVIVAGWEVDDAAALCFSENFYIELLSGKGFGDAVQIARQITYRNFSNRNTWGAYQCYGDPFYTLRAIPGVRSDEPYSFCDPIEPVHKLQSLLSQIETATFREENEAIEREIECIIKGVNLHPEWKHESSIIELLAELHKELRNYSAAIKYYEQLFSLETAGYSVRSIEQYCNIRVKESVQEFNDAKANGKDEKAAREAADLAIDQIIRRLQNVNSPMTSERMNLIGSAYRRKAEINASPADQDSKQKSSPRSTKAYRENLLESADHYRQGHEIFLDAYGSVHYYPLYNWLIIGVIVARIATQAETQKYKKTLELPALEILRELMEQATKYSAELDKIKPDFWNKTSESMRYLFELIVATKEADINHYKAAIVLDHTKAWQTEGSSNKQNAIKQHAEFVVTMIGQNKERLKSLKLLDKKVDALNLLMLELG